MTGAVMQRTRQKILDYLKQHNGATVEELSAVLDNLTAVTVRHHLDVLRSQGLVSPPEAVRRNSPGRPKYVYRLTEQAEKLFPKNLEALTEHVLAEMKSRLSPQQVNVIFEGVADRMAAQVPPPSDNEPIEARLDRVVEHLTAQGYQARLWLDLGDLGDLVNPAGPHEQWQDHGLGLLRTILHQNGVLTNLASTRACTSWDQVRRQLVGYDVLLMNVRSYTYPIAYRSAQLFKEVNPQGLVLVGGMHATVALDEMESVPYFDKIVQGPAEKMIVDLVRHPHDFPRVIQGEGARSMAEWPMIDRTLWPKPASRRLARKFHWPLEPECGWGPPPVATILTSRVCPWQCVFCNENSYIPNMGRRPVDMVIDELNYLDRKIRRRLGRHPRLHVLPESELAGGVDREIPTQGQSHLAVLGRRPRRHRAPVADLFEALIRETNWMTISIGFESGSDRVLQDPEQRMHGGGQLLHD
jgi:DNA-binding transcriptional ArsR family regulator